MTDRPILFSAPMVRALLDGRKTMTRRLAQSWRRVPDPVGKLKLIGCRPTIWTKVTPGDRLWVRETWQLHSLATDKATIVYAASVDGAWTDAHLQLPAGLARGMSATPFQQRWRSPIHMPRWASRLTLIVTDTKIERLQKITDADALAEGVTGNANKGYGVQGFDLAGKYPRSAFAALWSMLHGLHGDNTWDANPEVVALTFTVAKQNIDTFPKAKAGEARAA